MTSQHTSSDTILSTLPCLEYIQDKLHVTAFYNKREQANEAHEYVSSSAVRDALGSVGRMVIIAWTITPRTITARVKLNSQQIELYDHQDYLSQEELSVSCVNKSLMYFAYYFLFRNFLSFYEWLFGPEKFSGLSRNGPLGQYHLITLVAF